MSIRKSGGYRKLASFQSATLIYDSTYGFCEKFLDSRSRTVDQMVQAARSGRQNAMRKSDGTPHCQARTKCWPAILGMHRLSGLQRNRQRLRSVGSVGSDRSVGFISSATVRLSKQWPCTRLPKLQLTITVHREY